MGFVPDHLNKLSIAIEQVIHFLLVEGFAFIKKSSIFEVQQSEVQ